MAQPHKGDRKLIASRPPTRVYQDVHDRALAHGISISQYVADVLAMHTGHTDLVVALGREREVQLAM